MSKNYYNKWEFQQALNLSKTNPIESKFLFEKYIEKYPEDYSAYAYYSTVLVKLGEFEEAEKILNFVEKISYKDSHFTNIDGKVKQFEQSVIYSRIQLLSYQEKYDQLYKFYLENIEKIRNQGYEFNHVLFYCNKKLQKLNLNERENHSYLFKQIVRYEESDFFHHIQKHLADYNMDLDNPNKNIFVPGFPINEIIMEIKKYIPSDKKLLPGLLEDEYVFKYNECGRDNNKLVDYFKVICFHNTKDFITICPATGCENLPYVDLNYLNKDIGINKVKRISQIERFNKKYKYN